MPEEIKIYTKSGDSGKTSLLGGTRVPKYDERIEAYGTLDELNAFIGLIRDQEIDRHYRDVLIGIQNKIFAAESSLAADQPERRKTLPRITEADITQLENEIDRMNNGLPGLKSFVLPGGHTTVSYCHIARTICRRAERLTTKLSEHFEVDSRILKYLNRLSDYFFMLARRLSADKNVEETLWRPDKQGN